MAVVVDASAVAAVLFGEPEGDAVRRQLRGHVLHAPSLIDDELTHVAWKKLQRSPSSASAIFEALSAVPRLNVTCVQPDAVHVLATAAAARVSTYDASYLWLARTLGVRLVTLDKALARTSARLT